MLQKIKMQLALKLIEKFTKINRLGAGYTYIKGTGIEVGAMDLPLRVSKDANVLYFDRCSKEESAKIFPEIAKNLVDVSLIGDGETLDSLESNSYDFIIGNHIIEHMQNPILTIKNMLRVIKSGGVVFMAMPDKRYTFDIDRELTTMEHFCKDYEEGCEWSEHEHYLDFVKHTDWGKGKNNAEIEQTIVDLKNKNFSIHFHVWNHQSMLDMLSMLKSKYNFQFEIQLAISANKNENESVFILKKY